MSICRDDAILEALRANKPNLPKLILDLSRWQPPEFFGNMGKDNTPFGYWFPPVYS